MKVRLIFAILSLLCPRLCLSCGEPAELSYDIQISLQPPVPVVGERLELRCSVGGASIKQWQSGVVSEGSKLTWSEGGVTDWTAYSGREFVYDSGRDEAVLRISNFSIEDYGVYKCHCINDFTYLQYEICGGIHGLTTHCSAPIETYLQPSTQLYTEFMFVETPGETVGLPLCTNSSSGWIRIGSSGLHEELAGKEVTVNAPQDQAKFVCITHTNNLEHIVYVAISDYQPLQILYPVSDNASLVLTNNAIQYPACATLTSLPTNTTTTLSLFRNDEVIELDPIHFLNAVAVDVQQCDWITIYFVDELVLNETSGETFSCTVYSQWETRTRNFTFANVPTTQPQRCSVAHDHTNPSPIIHSPSTSIIHSPSTTIIHSPSTTIIHSPSTTIIHSPFITPTSPSNEDDGNSLTLVIAGAGVVAVLVILAVLFVICSLGIVRRCRRGSQPRKMYALPEDAPEADLEHSAQLSLIDSSINQHSNGFSHSLQQFTHNGVPVSRQMAKCISGLQQSPWLFPYEKLEFQEELGSGAFGVVKKALAHSLQPGEPATVVAVKMLKDGAYSEEHEEKDIISELKVLKHVGAHPNIVCLLGASVNNGMLYVIVEYCCNGNLLKYLRSKRKDQSSPLTARQCVDMAAQVATGMEFLASKDCIHRDLAARNVLITDDFVLKVADFGLARKVYESVYRPSGGKVPVKWLAPESIIDHMYTTQSDVWSFGIVLWEILSLGRAPYPGKSAETMLRDLQNGYRMPRPPSCPVQVYDVMLKCWQWSSDNRPTFSELVGLIEEILTADEPALNRHYYNMDVSGEGNELADHSMDSTLCSCEELDTLAEGAVRHTCHSCGNIFTTTRKLSSDPEKVFCDDCSQMPEYLSRSSLDLLSSCDESGTLGRRTGRRWTRRLHSADSGVKVSLEEEASLEDSQATAAFARKLTKSLQSMCSECKIELDPAGPELWGDDDDNDMSQSTISLCTGCRELVEGHTYTNGDSLTGIEDEVAREREEYMKQRMEKVLASRERSRPKSIDDTLLIQHRVSVGGGGRERDRLVREEAGDSVAVHVENGLSYVGSGQKIELRQKDSSDSGIKLTPEPVYLKRVSAPPMTLPAIRGLFSPTSPWQSSGCSTPGGGRLSAHPRNRDIFEQLGIKETDL